MSKQLVKQFERALTTSAMGRFDALVKQIPKVGRRRESLSGQCWWMLFLVVHALILCSIQDVVEVVCLCVCVVCVCVVCVCVVCVCVCVCLCMYIVVYLCQCVQEILDMPYEELLSELLSIGWSDSAPKR